MFMIILSWNVRGIGESTKRAGKKDFCHIHNIDVVCLQETKTDKMDISIIRSTGGSYIWENKCAVGSSGGLLIGWKQQFWIKHDVKIGEFSLTVILESVNKDFKWAISNVYGPHNCADRMVLWHELYDFRAVLDNCRRF